eukprot:6176631-Pleurochrysis_carterae.AAC.1
MRANPHRPASCLAARHPSEGALSNQGLLRGALGPSADLLPLAPLFSQMGLNVDQCALYPGAPFHTDALGGNMPAGLTGNISNKLPGNFSGNLSGNLPGNLPGNSSGNMRGDFSGGLSGEVSSQTAFEMQLQQQLQQVQQVQHLLREQLLMQSDANMLRGRSAGMPPSAGLSGVATLKHGANGVNVIGGGGIGGGIGGGGG